MLDTAAEAILFELVSNQPDSLTFKIGNSLFIGIAKPMIVALASIALSSHKLRVFIYYIVLLKA